VAVVKTAMAAEANYPKKNKKRLKTSRKPLANNATYKTKPAKQNARSKTVKMEMRQMTMRVYRPKNLRTAKPNLNSS